MEQEDSTEITLRLQKCLQWFIDHVDALKEEDDPSGDGFTREFRVIRDQGMKERENNTYPAEEGKKSFNIKKNRYKDILPFDETRVPLKEIPGEEGSDYINANFIQDQYGVKCYIATQGPVPTTVYDFWRMILQYRVKVIAMACRMVEMGKKKCEQYWPDELNETTKFGDISVTLVSQEDLAEHCTKRVLLASVPDCDSLIVTQFHYTGWPDHDIPHDFDVILEMMAEMREIKSHDEERAPMVIHCSAGCGRTGTMIAIDFVWDLLKSGNMDDKFSLYDIVKLMRTQRQSMIQAPEQYMMVHVTVQTLFQKHLDMMEDHIYGNIGSDRDEVDDEKQDGSVSEAGSEASHLYESIRKKSVMAQDIVKTIQKVTQAPTAEELLSRESAPSGLQEPLTPTQAVYVAPSTSTQVKDVINKFADKDKSKSFPVEKIDNIPSVQKVELRYLNNIPKTDSTDKKLSFISNELGQKCLEEKKAMFEKPIIGEKPLLEPQRSSDKVGAGISKPVTEKNHNQSTSYEKPEVSAEKPVVQRINSQQRDNKHVTVVSVVGSTPKPSLSKAVSVPTESKTPAQNNDRKSKTLPNRGNPFQDTPQSSVPPDAPVTQRSSVNSVVGNSHFYSSLSDYSSLAPKTDTSSVSLDPYSSIANYSSANGIKKQEYPHSTVQGNPGEVTRSAGLTNSSVYSYAVEPQMTQVYATVEKPVKPAKALNGTVSDGVYETVSVGSVPVKGPPVLPERGYLEDTDNQNIDKSGAGDMNTLGKKAQLTSAIKNLFSSKINSAASDHMVPSDIPGFKSKIGKKPHGPKDPPMAWKKK